MKKLSLFLLIFLAIFPLSRSICGEDAPGCGDHPLLTRMSDFYIQDCEKKDYDVYSFYSANGTVDIEGKKTFISHVVNDYSMAPSDLQIQKNFENALQKRGAVTEFKDKYNLYMSIRQDGKETWVHVRSWNDGEGYDLTIIEKGSLTQDVMASGTTGTIVPDTGTSAADERFSTAPSKKQQTEIGSANQSSAGPSTQSDQMGAAASHESSQSGQMGTSSSQQSSQPGSISQPASQDASLRLTYPNGGEEFISGHSYDIKWECTGDPGPLTLSLVQYREGMGTATQGAQVNRIIVAKDFPNSGVLNWSATRTGGPPSRWKLQLSGSNAIDDTDGPIMIAPYIELFMTTPSIYNPVKKENWFLRTLKAVVTAGLSEAENNTSVIREGIDYIKDDNDEGAGLKRGTDIIVEFAVMQFGTRQMNESVLSRITILELPSRSPIEVLACDSRMAGPLVSYTCRKRFRTKGPLFKAKNYLLEISVDPNKTIPEEEIFRDNNTKTIEFELKP